MATEVAADNASIRIVRVRKSRGRRQQGADTAGVTATSGSGSTPGAAAAPKALLQRLSNSFSLRQGAGRGRQRVREEHGQNSRDQDNEADLEGGATSIGRSAGSNQVSPAPWEAAAERGRASGEGRGERERTASECAEDKDVANWVQIADQFARADNASKQLPAADGGELTGECEHGLEAVSAHGGALALQSDTGVMMSADRAHEPPQSPLRDWEGDGGSLDEDFGTGIGGGRKEEVSDIRGMEADGLSDDGWVGDEGAGMQVRRSLVHTDLKEPPSCLARRLLPGYVVICITS